MTMLYSFYAADKRITHLQGKQPLDAQHKVFPLPGFGLTNGVIGFFGLAQLGGRPMSIWLQDVISRYGSPRDADSFARHLSRRIEGSATSAELEEVSGFHIGTFERRAGDVVPTFTFMRNATDFKDGVYSNVGKYIPPDEQLLGRDLQNVPTQLVRDWLRQRQKQVGIPHWYRNGDVRHFGAIGSFLEVALSGLMQQQGTMFRSPRTLDEWRRVARTLVSATGSLYRSYYAGAVPPVGGRVDVEAIPWPN